MGIFLAGLALFVALCGLWIGTIALKKFDSQASDFLKGPVQGLRDAITKIEGRIDTTQQKVGEFNSQTEDAIKTLKTEKEQLSKALASTNAKITALEKQQAQGRPGHDGPGPVAPAATD